MRYRLRTLLIVLAVGPPLLWLAWMSGAEAQIVFLVFFPLGLLTFLVALFVSWLAILFGDKGQSGVRD